MSYIDLLIVNGKTKFGLILILVWTASRLAFLFEDGKET